jgi:CDP-glucose 4,6-dehydratase
VNIKQLSHIKRVSGPILVTGHTGFKGTWLTLLLERLGIEVIGLSLPPLPTSLYKKSKRIGKIKEDFFDIRDSNAVHKFIKENKPSVIIHLAAQPLVLESYKNPKYTFEVNVIGTSNVLEAAFKTNSTEVVLISTTDKVYENNNLGKAFFETDPLRGKDPYSASKVAAENVIYAWREIKNKSGGPVLLTARAGNIIGGGDLSKNRLIPDLVRAFNSNSELVIRNPSSSRPWQHVLDPLSGYLLMIDNAINGDNLEVLNFGPIDKSMKVKEVVKIASKHWGNKSTIVFSKEKSTIEAKSLELDSSLARKTLNWSPFWNQSEAIIETINWWKEVLNKSLLPEQRCNFEINKMFTDM